MGVANNAVAISKKVGQHDQKFFYREWFYHSIWLELQTFTLQMFLKSVGLLLIDEMDQIGDVIRGAALEVAIVRTKLSQYHPITSNDKM